MVLSEPDQDLTALSVPVLNAGQDQQRKLKYHPEKLYNTLLQHINKVLECSRGIVEFEEHSQVFKLPIAGLKCGLDLFINIGRKRLQTVILFKAL